MNKRLPTIAARLQSLSPPTPQQATPLTLAVGALYALRRAGDLGYVSKHDIGRGLHIWAEAKVVCQTLTSDGTLPETGEWLAGYFFNDAIVRIGVAYEHVLREATGAGDHEDYDLEKAKRLGFQDAWLQSWEPVRKEVNRLKHKTQRFVDGPLLTYDEAVQAIAHLVEALDRRNWVPAAVAVP